MRPVKLSFWGLRSYRERVDIDFTSLDLFAVIGDTGAGKSTIIEALSLALYARKTWKGGGPLETLITDGEPALNIELVFMAEARTWTVTRRRGRSAGPIDRLVSDDGEKVDGAKEVNARIQALIGLDHDQFVRAVVLPQGRFDELLQTSDSERTKVLRSILDLDDVSDTKTEVDRLLVHWRGEQQKWQAARDQHPRDPAAELAEAKRLAVEADERRAALEVSATKAQGLDELITALERADRELAGRLERVPGVEPDVVERLGALLPGWCQSTARGASIREDLDDTGARRSTLSDETVTVLAGFETRDRLAGAASAVARVVTDLPAALDALHGATGARAELGDPPVAIVDTALESARLSAVRAREQAEEEQRRAGAARTAAATVSAAWREVLDDEREAQGELEELARQVAAAEEALTGVAAEMAEADARLAAAVDLLDRARRADAAATAGADGHPGDECPVCRQELPDGYEPPVPSVDTAEAAKRVEEAQVARDTVDDQRRVQEHKTVSLRTRHDAAESRLEDLRGRKAARVEEGRALGLDLQEAHPDVGLGPFDQACEAADAALARAADAERLAADAVRNAENEIRVAQERYDVARSAAEDRLVASQSAVDRLAASLDGLPTPWAQSEIGDALDRATAIGCSIEAATRRLDEIDVAISELDARERMLRDEQNEVLVQAQRARSEAATCLAAVTARIGEVAAARSWAVADSSFGAHLEQVPDVEPVVIDADDPVLLTDRLGEIDARLARAQAVFDALAALRAESAVLHDRHREELDALVADTGCASLPDVLTELGAARKAQSQSQIEIDRLSEASSRAAALDAHLVKVRPFVANLSALAVALRDGQFIGHLVSQREGELLAEASRRLKTISGETFAFAAGFRIVNIRSGEAREPEALSGGERFQAALALALALVEIASRGGGGRLDSVFIDEGFGSLDAGSLEQALDALGAVSGGGKMVALVSHLRAVAEYVDDVIYVTKDDTTGSRLELLDAEKQEKLLESASTAGLTS